MSARRSGHRVAEVIDLAELRPASEWEHKARRGGAQCEEFLAARAAYAASLRAVQASRDPRERSDRLRGASRDAPVRHLEDGAALAPPGFYAAKGFHERKVRPPVALEPPAPPPEPVVSKTDDRDPVPCAEVEARRVRTTLERACREHLRDLIREHPERARALLRRQASPVEVDVTLIVCR